MDFTLNTIMGEQDCHDYASLVMRSCFVLTRAKRLSLGWAFNKKRDGEEVQYDQPGQQYEDEDVCVVSFQRKESKKRGNKVLGSGLFTFSDHRDSIAVYNDHHQKNTNKHCEKDDDDETASTVDMDEDEFPVSASSTRRNGSQSRGERRVQFEKALVTAVHTRPRTTKEDKYYLHYDEYDYMDFKLEYRDDLLLEQRRKREQLSNSSNGTQQRRATSYRRSPRKVSFKREVVDSVHSVMGRDQRNEILSDLFYTEEEMRIFLDEFVASLQKQSLQQQQKGIPSS